MEKKQPLGAIPCKHGYCFSVWAPHAQKVSVIGTFNEWNPETHVMHPQDNGVWSLEVKTAKEGDEYRYYIVNGQNTYQKIDPYARQVTSSVGNGVILAPHVLEQTDSFSIAPFHELIIYELHIGTFGKKEGHDGPGTIKGAKERLAYLKDLGVNAVEIMPISEFAGGYSWGYNPSHLFAIETDYGTPQDFRDFIEEAHKMGIAVILDVVYNHFGPTDLDLWQFDGWNENNQGGIYFYNDWRSQTPWGDTRPDYGRPEVRSLICDNVLMWLKEYGIDGLRWDMTAFIRNVHGKNNDPEADLPDGWSLMQWVNSETKAVKPHSITIAEDLQSNPYLTKSKEDGGAGFDAQWASSFVHVVRDTLIGADDVHRDMEAIRHAIEYRYDSDAYERIVYTESHDEVANGKARVPEEVDPGNASSWAAKKKSCLGAGLVFTTPGIPMLFQGQEFLEDDWFHDQDPIDWNRKEQFAGILQLYKDLIALRLNRQGYTKGLTGQYVDVYHLNQESLMIAYHRWFSSGPGDQVVVVVNFSTHSYKDYALEFPVSGKWFIRLNSDERRYDKDFTDIGGSFIHAEPLQDEKGSAHSQIAIGPYSFLILSQDP